MKIYKLGLYNSLKGFQFILCDIQILKNVTFG